MVGDYCAALFWEALGVESEGCEIDKRVNFLRHTPSLLPHPLPPKKRAGSVKQSCETEEKTYWKRLGGWRSTWRLKGELERKNATKV